MAFQTKTNCVFSVEVAFKSNVFKNLKQFYFNKWAYKQKCNQDAQKAAIKNCSCCQK